MPNPADLQCPDCSDPGDRRPLAPLLLISTIVLVMASCGHDRGSAPDGAEIPARSRSTTVVTASTTMQRPVEEEVEAAYLDIMRRYYRSMTRPDSTASDIRVHHVGNSAKAYSLRASEMERKGQRARFTARGAPVPTILTVRVHANTAFIRNCVVDDVRVVDDATSMVVDGDVVTYLLASTLHRLDGRWRLANQEIVRTWNGRRECAE